MKECFWSKVRPSDELSRAFYHVLLLKSYIEVDSRMKLLQLFIIVRVFKFYKHQHNNSNTTCYITRMLYWTSWPDNADAVAVQLDMMIINA